MPRVDDRQATGSAVAAVAAGLADLAPHSVGAKVMDWLLAYDSRTLVPHDHHPAAGVPLYRVNAAAAGSLNAWERQAAAADSARLLRLSAPDWPSSGSQLP